MGSLSLYLMRTGTRKVQDYCVRLLKYVLNSFLVVHYCVAKPSNNAVWSPRPPSCCMHSIQCTGKICCVPQDQCNQATLPPSMLSTSLIFSKKFSDFMICLQFQWQGPCICHSCYSQNPCQGNESLMFGVGFFKIRSYLNVLLV